MIINTIHVGHLSTNCYVITDGSSGEGIVIDPGGDVEKILAVLDEGRLRANAIILTHGHWDHIAAAIDVSRATGAGVFIHRGDGDMAADPMKNLSIVVANEQFAMEPDHPLEDGQVITVGQLEVKVIHTPGHTQGGVSLLIGDKLFCGDLIFRESVGRTGLPGSDSDLLRESILIKVMTLPDSVELYPGHGDPTTVGWERENNPYINRWLVA